MAAMWSNRIRLAALLIVAAALVAIVVYPLWRTAQAKRLQSDARTALERGRYGLALKLSTRWLQRQPDSVEAVRLAAESSASLGRDDEAVEYYNRLINAGHARPADRLALGEIHWRQLRPADAEQQFLAALQSDAEFYAARSSLIELLSLQCRARESLAQRRELLRQGIWTLDDLLSLAKPADLVQSPDLDAFLSRNPDDPYLLLAKSRQARLMNQLDDAQRWLGEALRSDPELLEARVDQGLLLLEQQPTLDEFARWSDSLPPSADGHPDVWIVRGFWAKQRGDERGAARCFAEALLREPEHHLAAHQLSLLLAACGDGAVASELSSRVALLDELHRTVDTIYDYPEAQQAWRQAAQLLESLGRIREAAAWRRMLSRGAGGDADAEKSAELVTRLAAVNLVEKLDLNQYPLPDFYTVDTQAGPQAPTAAPRAIRLSDVAEAAGLQFVPLGAELPVRRPRRMFDLFGCGVAVFDFDLDGWPDVFCAQAAPEADAAQQDDDQTADQLFRNFGGRFERALAARLDDRRYSHGAAAGDFNNDGFVDLLLANVGENRLYQNNGDGTFSEVSERAGIGGGRWTTSVMLADLNGDGLPDIYEVNYLGEAALLRLCDGPRGRYGGCTPRDYPAAGDRFFLNLGDGRFVEQTAEAGFVGSEGKGLGVVAADFNGDGLLSVFVANDTTANHFYENQTPRGAAPRFVERAALAGLAYDRNGLTQGCMGIAVDDVDADGQLDLLVTNFSDEPNTLYRGREGTFFDDQTRAAALFAPSYKLLGFGTEFFDADLDGDPDLAIANGHIVDEGPAGGDFQMRPQFFENRGGAFVELFADDVGDYFQRKLLGRALARVDFDRDGLEEFVVSHLDAPVALLHNETPGAGHFLAVRLLGVESDRDAVGATVTVVDARGVRRVKQLTAGDGYMCSNERRLVFGLGDADQAVEVAIRWPSGLIQELKNVPADREWTIVESRGAHESVAR